MAIMAMAIMDMAIMADKGQQWFTPDPHSISKGLLELLDGRVGEGVEDVGFLRHDGAGGGAGGS